MKNYLKLKQLMIALSMLVSVAHLNAEGRVEGASKTEIKATEELNGGPNGGRLVTTVEPYVEFLLKDDRTVQITFLDKSGTTVPPAKEEVRVIGGKRAAPTTLSFKQAGDVLVSEGALPEGKNLPIILEMKMRPEGKTVRERFYLNLSVCGGCDYAEYACTCGH